MNLSANFILAAASGGGNGESQPLDLGGTASNAHAASGGSVAKTIVGLAIVLAVIFGLRWVMKHYKAGREKKAAGTGLAQVATLPLGRDRSLHVVRAGREVLVVGSGEHGVTPVRSYSEEEARALGLLEVEDDEESPLKLESDGPTKSGAAGPAGEIGKRALDQIRAWTVRG
jgi:flagellar protein FliO/FliZ